MRRVELVMVAAAMGLAAACSSELHSDDPVLDACYGTCRAELAGEGCDHEDYFLLQLCGLFCDDQYEDLAVACHAPWRTYWDCAVARGWVCRDDGDPATYDGRPTSDVCDDEWDAARACDRAQRSLADAPHRP